MALMATVYHDRATRLRLESIVSRVSQQRWLELYIDPEHEVSTERLAAIARGDVSKLVWALVRWLEHTPPDAYPIGERETGLVHEWRAGTWEPVTTEDGSILGHRPVSPAELLLRDELAGGKEVRYRHLASVALAAGINLRTLTRTAFRMGVVCRRIGFGSQHASVWMLPNTNQPE
jgi:hypothetical protein